MYGTNIMHVLYGRIKYQSSEIWYVYEGVDEIVRHNLSMRPCFYTRRQY